MTARAILEPTTSDPDGSTRRTAVYPTLALLLLLYAVLFLGPDTEVLLETGRLLTLGQRMML
jgi:hypothetical protein